jgi:hypothetical protein
MGRWAFLLGVVLVVTQPSFVHADSPRPGVTEANVKRIRPGMTMKEVTAILGPPEVEPIDPELYARVLRCLEETRRLKKELQEERKRAPAKEGQQGRGRRFEYAELFDTPLKFLFYEVWKGDEGTVTVWRYGDRVESVEFAPARQASPLDLLRALLGW